MKKKNFFAILFCTAILFVALGTFLFKTNPSIHDKLSSFIGKEEQEFVIPDTIPYMEKLLKEIPVLKVMPKKKRDTREIWKVGKGVSYSNYLLKAQKHLIKYGGKVLSMEEIESRVGKKVADFDFIAPFGDTFHVELQTADIFQDNTSRLAVAFYADSHLKDYIQNLNSLTYPYTLFITPIEKTPELSASLRLLKNYETAIWLPMEANGLQPAALAKTTIYIHQSEKEIQDIVDQALTELPKATGVVTRMGSRAVEQQALLKAILLPLSQKGFWFLDLTQNRYSKSMDVCNEFKMKCRKEPPYKPEKATADQYVSKALSSATRTGKAIILLPLSNKSFSAIDSLSEKAALKGTEIVNLSNIFQKEE